MQSAPGETAVPAAPALIDLRGFASGAVLPLNNAHQAETSLLDATSYDRLVAAAGFAMAVGGGDEAPDAFLIAFSEESDHDNGNLAWFRARHDRFFYVDRIIVSPAARGRGLARVLYGALFEQARLQDRRTIGCEINVVPPNPASDALHEVLGFTEIARREAGQAKSIRYMRLTLA